MLPFGSRASTSTPASNKVSATLVFWPYKARTSGTCPVALRAFRAAPCSTSRRTIAGLAASTFGASPACGDMSASRTFCICRPGS